MLRLYRGVLPPLASMPLKNAVYMTAQAQSKAKLEKCFPLYPAWAISAFSGGFLEPASLTESQHCLIGLAGIPEAIFVTPFEQVKVRLMAAENIHKYKNAVHCAQMIAAEEGGLRALMQGLEATCWRNMVLFRALIKDCTRFEKGLDCGLLLRNLSAGF